MFLASAFQRRRGAEIAKSRRKAEEKPQGDPGTQVHYQRQQAGGEIIPPTSIVHKGSRTYSWNEHNYMPILLFSHTVSQLIALHDMCFEGCQNKWNL